MLPFLLFVSTCIAAPRDSILGRSPKEQIQSWAQELKFKSIPVPDSNLSFNTGKYFSFSNSVKFIYQGATPYPFRIEVVDGTYMLRSQISWNGQQLVANDSSCRISAPPRTWSSCEHSDNLKLDAIRKFAPRNTPTWKTLASYYLDRWTFQKNEFPYEFDEYSENSQLFQDSITAKWILSANGTLQREDHFDHPFDGVSYQRILRRKADKNGNDTLLREIQKNKYDPDSITIKEVRFGYDSKNRVLWDWKSRNFPVSEKEKIKYDKRFHHCLRRYHHYDALGRDTLQVFVTPFRKIIRGIAVLEYNNKNDITRRYVGTINATGNTTQWLRSEKWAYDSLDRLTNYGYYQNNILWDNLSFYFDDAKLFPSPVENCEY